MAQLAANDDVRDDALLASMDTAAGASLDRMEYVDLQSLSTRFRE